MAEILGCLDIDYHQLRRLFNLARYQFNEEAPAGQWSRYTLRDIAAVRVALDLAGGLEALGPGRRLQIAPVVRACAFLLDDGIRDPLLEVPMERTGRTVFVKVDGNLIDPSSGQGVLAEVFGLTRKYVMKREATLLTRMRDERDLRLRQAREVRTLRRPVEVSGSGVA